jgi:hypothetical protein
MENSSAEKMLEWREKRQADVWASDGMTKVQEAKPFSLSEPSVKMLRLSGGSEPNISKKRDKEEDAAFLVRGNLIRGPSRGRQGGEGGTVEKREENESERIRLC